MADIDAELLALAGGDSSGEESAASPPRRKSSSPATYEKEDTPPSASRKPAGRLARKGRRRRDYSDEEDEEMSISGESQSASMSRSESEAEFEATDAKPMFPYDKLYYSAHDKAEIDAKPEIEREAILAERNEQVEKHEQNAQLRRMLSARAKEEAKQAAKNKRKASAADLDDNQRKSSRQRTKIGGGRAGEANTAIAAYKKQREEKNLRAEERKNRVVARRKDPLRDDFSDADAEGESDNDYDDRDRRFAKKRTPSPPKDDPPAELADIQRVRIGRENFAQVCWTPGFETSLTGCYARVCLGPGRVQGQNEYRLCSIKGFQEGKPYAIVGPNGKSFIVNKYIIAAHGKATKPWSFLECSNSRFTDDEWRRYRLTMANEDCRMPTRGLVNMKLADINKLISHKFTDAEISTKLKQQKQLEDMVNRTAERRELKDKIYDAEQRGDDDEIRELEDRLMNLVPIKLAFNTYLNPGQANRGAPEADRMAELNKQNQKRTQENMQKAAMLKRRMIKKKQTDSDKLAPPKALDDDLFGSASDISRAGTPVNGGPRSGHGSRAGTPLASTLTNGGDGTPRSSTPSVLRTGTDTKKGLPMIKKTKRDDEVLQGLDLGIDIDI